ncbi:hypothetical protein ABNG03_09575 [Halorubrum sp. RMP-47]|uniref:Uncharacterized protein n=1 Tax=Halorubrum miltondacostae TaxID=3076378 RepID=A0ABD5M7I9_9EURY
MVSGDNKRDPSDERRDSVTTFVEDLADINQPVNERYPEGRPLYDIEITPFWFTKGMPLATDGDDERYSEGIVPATKKQEDYFEAVAKGKYTGGDAFERDGERLFIGVPGANSVPLAGMDSHLGRLPPAPDPRGKTCAAEMLDAYAMEQLRDVPFTA